MVVHDQEDLLEQHLPQFLSQPSKTSYEVIVVDDSSTDRTPDILKKMKEEYPQLHTTFFPKSVPNPSRIQLALNIGIKATHGEWIVLADINRPPTSAEWIDGLINNDAEVTMVYSTTKHPEEVRH
jgi:glycosyltransferase involved in cell wall biosynthesis